MVAAGVKPAAFMAQVYYESSLLQVDGLASNPSAPLRTSFCITTPAWDAVIAPPVFLPLP
jgi:hypothetical protein